MGGNKSQISEEIWLFYLRAIFFGGGMFFSDNSARIVEFQGRLKGLSGPIAQGCHAAIAVILAERDRYDQECKYLPEVSGQAVLKAMLLIGSAEAPPFSLYFFTACVREVTMSANSRGSGEQEVLDYFKSPEVAAASSWDGWYQFYLDMIFNLLPMKVTSSHLAGISERRDEISNLSDRIKGDFSEFKKLYNDIRDDLRGTAAAEKDLMLGGLRDFSERIEGYRGELGKIESDYNFVGLSHAFKGLIKVKKSEVTRYFFGVVVTGFLALGAPMVVAFWVNKTVFDGVLDGAWSVLATMKFVGLVGFELVLLYYFRIALKSFLLAKDQQANLMLRLALCQFIEGYCEFSEKAKGKGLSLMKGFEDLIFSPLPANDKSLPPTIDGMDGIVKIVAALRPGK